jgi:hypothetical protein
MWYNFFLMVQKYKFALRQYLYFSTIKTSKLSTRPDALAPRDTAHSARMPCEHDRRRMRQRARLRLRHPRQLNHLVVGACG